MMRDRARIIGVVRRAEDIPRLRAHGIVAVVADLDDFTSLRRLALAPFAVLHCAPPPSEGRDDPRTQKLVAALTRARIIPQRFVYISTSGVYGDCVGARVDETRPRKPQTPRARRRVGGGRPASRVERPQRRRARYPARTGHLLRRAVAARPPEAGDARARAGRRRVHQPHPRRRSRARRGRRDIPRQSQPRLQRRRRRRDEDGNVVRHRRRRLPPAAPAPRIVGRGGAAHRAHAAVVHERVAQARQRAREARASRCASRIRRRSRCSRRSRRGSSASSSRCSCDRHGPVAQAAARQLRAADSPRQADRHPAPAVADAHGALVRHARLAALAPRGRVHRSERSSCVARAALSTTGRTCGTTRT